MPWTRRLLWLQGRLTPADYWPAAGLVGALHLAVTFGQLFAPPQFLFAFSAPIWIAFYLLVAVSVKRLHDAGRSGVWFLALYGAQSLVALLAMLFLAGPITEAMTPVIQQASVGDADLNALIQGMTRDLFELLRPTVYVSWAIEVAWLVGLGRLPSVAGPTRFDWPRPPPAPQDPETLPAPEQPIRWGGLLFDFNGRLGVKRYWIAWAILAAIRFVLLIIPVVGPVLTWGALWSDLAIKAKRLHDFGRSAWWLVLPCLAWWVVALGVSAALIAAILPMATDPDASPNPAMAFAFLGGGLLLFLVDAAAFLAIGLIPGHPGHNRFGPPPTQRAAPTIADGPRRIATLT